MVEHTKNSPSASFQFVDCESNVKLKDMPSNNTVTPSTSTSFDDCDGADFKLEMKEEETLDEDPLSIKLEAEDVEIAIKEEIEDRIQNKDSCEHNSDIDKINTIDIVKHEIL